MLNDKQILNVDPSAQLMLLLDTSIPSGEAQNTNAFRERVVNQQLKQGNVHDVHSRFVRWAEEASPLIPLRVTSVKSNGENEDHARQYPRRHVSCSELSLPNLNKAFHY